MSNLPYVAPCEIKPNRDRVAKLRLWAVDFNILGESKGCAVIKAANAKNAIDILRAEGTYNGTPKVYNVIGVQEIDETPIEGLISEQILSYEN